MDHITQYRTLIKQIFSQQAQFWNENSTRESRKELLFDERHDNYMIFNVGWTPDERVHDVFAYVRLRNNKFWIEEDWTEEGIVTQLLQAGIPNQDIVLAFNPPDMRQYTEFAVA